MDDPYRQMNHADGEVLDDLYRHPCEIAERSYAEGLAVVFYDVSQDWWVLALLDQAALINWRRIPTRPNPLEYRYDKGYSATVIVNCCPWCALELPVLDDVVPDLQALTDLLVAQHYAWWGGAR